MKKLLLTTLTAVSLATFANAGIFSKDTLIDEIENVEYTSKVSGGYTHILFDDKFYQDGNKLDFKLNKDNELSLFYDKDKVLEKSKIANYKDEALLFEISEKWGEKVRIKNVFIKRELLRNPRECPEEMTTPEAYSHIIRKNGRIHCSTLFRDTKKFYEQKINSQKLLKDLEGKWKDKNSNTTFEFKSDGTWFKNGRKQGLFSEDREYLIKLNYANGYSYSFYHKPYFGGDDYKKTKCTKFTAYNGFKGLNVKDLTLCKQN